jgi:hypothetical protein
MMQRRSLLAALLAVASVGCMTEFQAEPIPTAQRAAGTRYYVERHEKDERGLDQTIAAECAKRAVSVSSGPRSERPPDVDVLVSYEDRWQWDMTMYLLSLRIDLRDPSTNALYTTGTSMQTSLARKPAEEVIASLVAAFFGGEPGGEQ